MEQNQSFFQKVGTRKERERAFILLTQSKSTFECQMPGKQIITMIPDFIQDSFMMVISKEEIPLNQEVIVTFSIGQEKYFMKTTFTTHDFERHYKMNLEPALFKLQRRNSFRVQIPTEYLAKVYLHHVDGKVVTQKFPLFDLSGGGFSFEIPSNNPFQVLKDQKIEGDIEIGGKFKKKFNAVIRHVIKVGSQGSGLSKIGTEFYKISPPEQQEIVNTVMEIHRDMFSKFKIGSR
jgi:c-di-GMP-binding flagellar brake protein YcgR